MKSITKGHGAVKYSRLPGSGKSLILAAMEPASESAQRKSATPAWC